MRTRRGRRSAHAHTLLYCTFFVFSREEPLEEALSPSQSTSSRATRWEALADIAAELPPSLTVDPLTGQIYALSK